MSVRTRILSLILALVIVLSMLPITASALDDISLSVNDAKELLNHVELHPQRTGYAEVDALMESILAPYNDRDTYTKVKNAYVWLIRNVNYSWDPYSQDYAPAYDCFDVIHELTYEEGLQESAPFEIVNRAYHAMAFHKGVCYDYAAAMALLLRYIGIDAFVHTGTFLLEDSNRTPCHHGWTEMLIDGKYYVIDPQREYRLASNGYGTIYYDYFIIPLESAWRYSEPEVEINAARDAQFLPVAAERAFGCKVAVESTASGTAFGSGIYQSGSKVTVNVEPTGELEFAGWFDQAGQLLSESLSYTFTVTKHTTLIAVFEGEYFIDVPHGEWYYKDANEAGERWIINGIRPFVFGAGEPITRAMAVTILGRAVKAEMSSGVTIFIDVPENEWFSGAVRWANQQSIVLGVSENEFAPNDYVTREQYITMLMRLVDKLEKTPELSELPYSDAEEISQYAVEPMQKAATIGLLSGYEDGTIRPQSRLNRAEGVALVMRLLRWLGM